MTTYQQKITFGEMLIPASFLARQAPSAVQTPFIIKHLTPHRGDATAL